MAEESFLLVSLKEDKAKKLAQVINNDTCRRILDHLASAKDATETSIAKELNIPISTVHYNIQHLLENKLVTVDEFHYSEKGKEVNHYKLSNKLIIIAQSDDETFLDKIRKLMPIGAISLLASGALFAVANIWNSKSLTHMGADAALADIAMPPIAAKEATFAMAQDTTRSYAANAAIEQAPNVITLFPDPLQIALWFLAGAAFMMIATLFWQSIRKRAK